MCSVRRCCDRDRDGGPEAGPACEVQIQVRWLEERPEGAEGWGQRSPIEVGEATGLGAGSFCVLGKCSALNLSQHLRLHPRLGVRGLFLTSTLRK